MSIDIEGPYGSEVVIDILRAFRLDEPHSWAQPQKPQDVPSPSERFGNDDRNDRDHDRQNCIFRMAMPSLQAKIKQQRGGFSDFFEVGVGEHWLEIGVKRGPARPSRSRVTRVASDDNAGGELMAAKVRPLPV